MTLVPTCYLGQKIWVGQIEKKSLKVYQGQFVNENNERLPVYILGCVLCQTVEPNILPF